MRGEFGNDGVGGEGLVVMVIPGEILMSAYLSQ